MTRFLASIDDFLFDRIYQPIVDLAAPLDVKARHLAASSELFAGAMSFVLHPKSLPIVPVLCVAKAYFLLYLHLPNGRGEYSRHRYFMLLMCLAFALVPPELLFAAGLVSAMYFCECNDKPPKRRWWKELKRAIESLAWMPELKPSWGQSK